MRAVIKQRALDDIAPTPWPETSERRLGEHLVYWDVRVDGYGCSPAVLQTRHEVGSTLLLFPPLQYLMVSYCLAYKHGR
jgi:hypothetical protein